MRREHEAALQPQDLLDLGSVTVGAHAVGLHVLVGEAEVRALGSLLARAGHAGHRIGHHGRRGVHEPRADSGGGGQGRGRGVAAGATHEHRLAGRAALGRGGQLVAGELGQAEGGLGQKLGGGVGRVPLLVDGRILQTEVGRQVDNGDAGGDEIAGHGHGGLVGHREERHVAGGQIGLLVSGERQVGHADESRIGLGDGGASQGIGGGGHQLELGMPCQKAH